MTPRCLRAWSTGYPSALDHRSGTRESQSRHSEALDREHVLSQTRDAGGLEGAPHVAESPHSEYSSPPDVEDARGPAVVPCHEVCHEAGRRPIAIDPVERQRKGVADAHMWHVPERVI